MHAANGSSVPESHRDLLDAPFATLATVGPTGRPQLSTVCFLACENDTVQLSLNATRQKSRNIVDNPKVALHILDATNSSRYLELRGDATVEPDHDYAFADRLGAKYGGLNLRVMDRPSEHRTVVTVSVTRVRAVDMRVPGTVGSSLTR
jgi:PPOX class probable F420-dependent enzyme